MRKGDIVLNINVFLAVNKEYFRIVAFKNIHEEITCNIDYIPIIDISLSGFVSKRLFDKFEKAPEKLFLKTNDNRKLRL